MQQHTKGVMGILLLVLLEIYSYLQQWKNLANFDKVIVKINRVSAFLDHPVVASQNKQLECGPMPNLMVALPNIGGALCSTPQSLADAHY